MVDAFDALWKTRDPRLKDKSEKSSLEPAAKPYRNPFGLPPKPIPPKEPARPAPASIRSKNQDAEAELEFFMERFAPADIPGPTRGKRGLQKTRKGPPSVMVGVRMHPELRDGLETLADRAGVPLVTIARAAILRGMAATLAAIKEGRRLE